MYEVVESRLIDIKPLERKELHIKDEYDTDSILETIEKHDQVCITFARRLLVW